MGLELNLTWNWKALHNAFFDNQHYSCIRAANRSGKTYGAVLWLLEVLLIDTNKTGIWLDTRHTNIDKYIDRYFKRICGDIWRKFNWNAQKKILTLPNKNKLDFGSAEKHELIQGFEYDYALINEAPLVLRKKKLYEDTVLPLTKKATNQTKFIGTPRGKGKFLQLCKQYPEYHFTVYDSPNWSKEEIKKMQDNCNKGGELGKTSWRQNYLAEFVEGAGGVFRNFKECIKGRLIKKPKAECTYVFAVDLAKHMDYTVILVADLKTKQIIFFDRFNAIDWSFQKKRIYNTWLKFNKPKGIIDSTGVGDAIFDDLKAAGMNVVPFRFTHQTKNELIENLSIAMDNREIFFPNIPELIGELDVFGFETSKSKNRIYSAPDGFHDDCVITLALLNKLLQFNQEVYISDFF